MATMTAELVCVIPLEASRIGRLRAFSECVTYGAQISHYGMHRPFRPWVVRTQQLRGVRGAVAAGCCHIGPVPRRIRLRNRAGARQRPVRVCRPDRRPGSADLETVKRKPASPAKRQAGSDGADRTGRSFGVAPPRRSRGGVVLTAVAAPGTWAAGRLAGVSGGKRHRPDHARHPRCTGAGRSCSCPGRRCWRIMALVTGN
jgi:hypothetical protein